MCLQMYPVCASFFFHGMHCIPCWQWKKLEYFPCKDCYFIFFFVGNQVNRPLKYLWSLVQSGRLNMFLSPASTLRSAHCETCTQIKGHNPLQLHLLHWSNLPWREIFICCYFFFFSTFCLWIWLHIYFFYLCTWIIIVSFLNIFLLEQCNNYIRLH